MNAIEIINLEKKYKDFPALKNVNLTVKQGDFFALLWVNGAGKTTIIWILTDLVIKTSWLVKIFWIDIDTNFSLAKSYVWVVPQEFNIDIFSKVINVIIGQAGYYGIPAKEAEKRAEVLLKELWLWEKKDVEVRTLSWWMKRRLMIARALVHKPKLLILDEPTAWVDINIRKSTYEFLIKLNKEGITILLTTHYLEEVEKLCKSLAVINKGEIIINTSKKEFFAKIETSRFEITLDTKIESIPDSLKKYKPEKIKDDTIYVYVEKKDTLNELFLILEKEKINIKDIKNKTNELEELFESLTHS